MESGSSSQRSIDPPKCPATSTENGIELTPQRGGNLHDSEQGIVGQKDDLVLPKVDGGKDAWLFLFGCFIFEALVWG
jgi:hypothetical protein